MEPIIVDLNNAASIKTACEKSGFFYVPVNESDIELLNDVLKFSKEFFGKEDQFKRNYLLNPNGLGYAPLKHVILDKTMTEVKESFSYRPNDIQYENDELLRKYFERMNSYSRIIYQKILESLGLDYQDYLLSINQGFNTLTLLHYPQVKSDVSKNIYGVAPHTDWGLITLLYTTVDGLQININNEWVDVPTIHNHFIVNIADMLEVLSGGKYKSTLHRVLVEKEKYSIAFFVDPNLDYIIEPCIKNTKYVSIKYSDYLEQKLDESYRTLMR